MLVYFYGDLLIAFTCPGDIPDSPRTPINWMSWTEQSIFCRDIANSVNFLFLLKATAKAD